MTNNGTKIAGKEMERLAFLIGRWEGETVVHASDGRTVPGRIHGEAIAILDGAWIQWSFEQTPNEVVTRRQRGRYLFGWDPVRQAYSAIYFDDRGNTLIEHTAQPLHPEALTFVGETVLADTGPVLFEDEISSDHDHHFRNRVHMTIDGVRHLHGVFECKRIG
ncbi:DUF1579 family protein [Rathayibacter iranicus]|uniref:DUF1579 domain-containing protein n=2 Tax=Rathayibacter iranicus TaxID=59737 RepID=A0AAD1AGA3_9MICO|nr:DUF1579 family protein [Rathayibacter iranicus]AZZ55691.1 DUF1579 domain-containing protein [Rathayibacter iranicus]MWV31176.1 DUF1579 domain-containing protein [Rathayibacter iranicus NCPPB 2253 = VKM Ac-1602]PPI47756.1 hypothetical protein C5E09_06235 [Rathayibacter iranicus]PPI61112.1 hypothetical protein C5E08_07170 [Rathayibacter iranicus]PPI73140.1 hypothetical protein C5E01_03485 [Rathayibacter iranicus]